MSPLQGTTGTSISLAGSEFDDCVRVFAVGASTIELDLVAVEANQLTVTIPAVLIEPGPYTIEARRNGATVSAADVFTVVLPSGLSFTPAIAVPDETVTMTGDFFGSFAGRVVVEAQADDLLVTPYEAQILSWSDSEVVFVVPFLPADGPGNVTVENLVGRVTVTEGLTIDGGPRVVSAVATSNTSILVQFSEALAGGPDSAENPDHYRITAPDTRIPEVIVMAASIKPNTGSTVVLLETLSQSDLLYTLQVISVFDPDGNPIPPPTAFVDPSVTTFVGVASTGLIDSDGDGLSDSDEQRGWTVTTFIGPVLVESWHATSNPGNPDLASTDPVNLLARDTDQDGVPDNEEKHGGMDPRSPDTDGDTLSDGNEWNVIYSNPVNLDTDGDGTQDGFEFYSFRTSPTLADTDGDQLSDTEEVLERFRDPRVADIARSSIGIGEVQLQIDERFTYQEAGGNSVVTESSSSSSLTEDFSRSSTSGDTKVLGAVITADIESGLPPTVSAGLEINGSYTWQSSEASATATQNVHEQSLAKTNQFDTSSAVTREVVGASIDVDVTLYNEGDISFSMSNIEITVLQRSTVANDVLIPIATLIPSSTLITGEPAVFNLGPFTPERGPILFSTQTVFPNEVEQLMRSPGGLVFKIANFDMTDEFGRFFSFSNQIARDRTAGIVIDRGDGQERRELVAVALQPDPDGYAGPPGGFVGGFGPDGSPLGIPLDFALQDILELPKLSSAGCLWDLFGDTSGCDGIVAGINRVADTLAAGDDIQLVPQGTTGISVGAVVIDPGSNGVLESFPGGDDQAGVVGGYETSLTCSAASPEPLPGTVCSVAGDCGQGGACTGPETLIRLGSLRNGDFNRKWRILTTGNIPASANFGQVLLEPGMDIYLAFLQDLDDDGLFAREEFLVGSSDSAADDYPNNSFGRYYRDFVPGVGDCPNAPDGCDGIADSKDTDRDGLGDFAEVRLGWRVGSGAAGALRQVYPSPRLRDTDGDGLLDSVEQDLRDFCFYWDFVGNDTAVAQSTLCAFKTAPLVAQADAVAIIAGPNGRLDSTVAAGDQRELPPGFDNCVDCFWPEETSIPYGYVVISEGSVAGIQSIIASDDLYVASLDDLPPASDPTLGDTDADNVSDYDELNRYISGFGLREPLSGGDGLANTLAQGDDVQKVFRGTAVAPGGLVILPGPNGRIDSVPAVDEGGVPDFFTGYWVEPYISVGLDGVLDTALEGDDALQACSEDFCFWQDIGPGPDGILDSTPAGDDYFAPSTPVATDPLRLDSDGDQVADGRELELGGNPADPFDGGAFIDSDQDGLTDAEETELGWDIYVDLAAPLRVTSNPNLPDTDFDGLPDLVERFIGSHPGLADTDADGLGDYDEFADFASYLQYADQFPGFTLDGSGSARYGTSPRIRDSDGDGLTDYQELIIGYSFSFAGVTRQIYTNPRATDTDNDGLSDLQEIANLTDATNPDTDGDGRSDGDEVASGTTDPLVPDLVVEVLALGFTGINSAATDNTLFSQPRHFMTWWFTTTVPGSSPDLLASPFSTLPKVDGGVYGFPGAASCAIYPMVRNSLYSLNFSSSDFGGGANSLVMQAGDSFVLEGVIGELDGVSQDCGTSPLYIPSFISDVQNCAGTFSQVYTYDDFAAGGPGATSAEFVLNGATCEFALAYSLTVK